MIKLIRYLSFLICLLFAGNIFASNIWCNDANCHKICVKCGFSAKQRIDSGQLPNSEDCKLINGKTFSPFPSGKFKKNDWYKC